MSIHEERVVLHHELSRIRSKLRRHPRMVARVEAIHWRLRELRRSSPAGPEQLPDVAERDEMAAAGLDVQVA